MLKLIEIITYEVFGGVLCCPLVFEFSVGIGGFVIGLSQISFFVSLWVYYTIPFGLSLFRHFWGMTFQLCKLLSLAKDH